MSLLRPDVPTEHAGPDRSADSIPEDDQAATIRSEDTDGVSHPGDDDGGDSAAVDHSGGMVAGQGACSGTPVTTARISDDVRPLFADGLSSEPSER